MVHQLDITESQRAEDMQYKQVLDNRENRLKEVVVMQLHMLAQEKEWLIGMWRRYAGQS